MSPCRHQILTQKYTIPGRLHLDFYKIHEPGTKKITTLTVLKILTKGLENTQRMLCREVHVTLKNLTFIFLFKPMTSKKSLKEFSKELFCFKKLDVRDASEGEVRISTVPAALSPNHLHIRGLRTNSLM